MANIPARLAHSSVLELPAGSAVNIASSFESNLFPPCFFLVDPAKIVYLESEHEVAAQERVSLVCTAEGNPEPTYTWTPCDSQQSVCHESVLNFQASSKSVYTFTCKVANSLGSDTRNTTLCKLVRRAKLQIAFSYTCTSQTDVIFYVQ